MDCIKSIKCRRASMDSYTSMAGGMNDEESKKWPRWKKILFIIGIATFSLLFLIFLAVWVAIPIAFMESISFQRIMMFMNIDVPKNPNYNNASVYGIYGVRNFYLTVLDTDNVTSVSIGAWLILPYDEINTTTSTNISDILGSTKADIIIYLHGVACNRAQAISQYGVIRKHFLIISIDHRGYGDSGPNVELSENGVVNDHLQIYDAVRAKTKNDIYYWGHSLGAALSVHTLRRLKETRNVVPKGLILESPFTTMREEVIHHPLSKIFSWLAYYNQTILDPLEYNGFHFYSTTHILSVDCPIMIMHAKDDNVIPYFLGQTLAKVATTKRNLTVQGGVTFHLFPAVGYMHVGITQDKQVPQFIEDFKHVCTNFSGMGLISTDLELRAQQGDTTKWPTWKTVLVITTIVLFCIIVPIIFVLIWVVIPVAFMLSTSFQNFMMFINIDDPKEPNFDDPSTYGIEGVVNFYITVLDKNTTSTSIGAWLILPDEEVTTTATTNVSDILKKYKSGCIAFLTWCSL